MRNFFTALFYFDMTPINEELYDPELLKKKMAKGLVRSPQLLAGSRFLDPSARDSPEYQDPNYFPFYFYLGQQLQSESVLQIGSRLGLVGACYLQGCRTAENWLAIDVTENGSVCGVVKGNIQRHCGGEVAAMYMTNPDAMKQEYNYVEADTVFVSEKFDVDVYKDALEYGWKRLKSGGILIADYISSDELQPIFASFCRVKNRESLNFETRYGVGIIRR